MKLLVWFNRSFLASNKILPVIILFFAIASVSLYREFMPDDAFIHIGYAKDIYEGKGYSFAGNATYGSTSPLWPLLIAGLASLNIDFETAAKLLSFVFAIASIILIYNVARLRLNQIVSVACTCLFCFNAYFMRWALTGMEASAACFFMLVLVYGLFKEKKRAANKYLYLLAGLSTLVRPEFYLFIFILFLYLFLIEQQKGNVQKLGLTMVPAIIWNSFAYIYYGTIVPSTFLSKAGESFFSTEWNTVIRSIKLILSGNPVEFGFIVIAISLLVWNNKKSSRISVYQIIKSEYAVIAVWILSFYLYYVLKNVNIISRYALVLLPLIILLTFLLLIAVCEKYNTVRKTNNYFLTAIVIASLMFHSLFTYFVVKPDADSFVRGFQREYKKIALMISENNKGGSVALSDVGIIGVYSGLKIYDLFGLVDKDRFRFSSKKEYLVNKKPQYLITRGEITIDELKDLNATINEVYTTTIEGFGINKTGNVRVEVYKIEWSK